MKLVSVVRTPNERKEFKAVFKIQDRQKIVRFGTASNFVTNAKKTEKDRQNYIARHRVREDFSNPTTAGALSRFILWGKSRSLRKNVTDFKKRFGV